MSKIIADFEYGQLYRSEDKIYPREVKGRFATFRKISMLMLLGMYYGGPWLVWGGRQTVLFDLPARKFYIFGLTMWPQDFIYLALLLIILAISLFFFTALAGRVWCGFACPQTVWTEAFTWIERLLEGDRNKRMKLDKSPWTFNKIWRKSAKQFLWITLALMTGFTFVGYFADVRSLTGHLLTLTAGPWEWFWVIFYGFATYGNAGFMREQVCKYMCPYARFQSAMFDTDTLVIAYDEERGSHVAHAGEGSKGFRPRCLYRLHDMCAGMSDRNRHPRGAAIRVHRVRGLHRRLRSDHGQDELPARPDSLQYRERHSAQELPSDPAAYDRIQPDPDLTRGHYGGIDHAPQTRHSGRPAGSQHALSGCRQAGYREQLYS